MTKIEAAPDETRVYVTVRNQSAYDFSFYSHSAKFVADGQSIKSSYSGDYKEPASAIPSDSRTSGVIVFEPISTERSPSVDPRRLFRELGRGDPRVADLDIHVEVI